MAPAATDAAGTGVGYRAGKTLYSRPNSFFFRREHLIKTHEFYERHGGKTIIIARFMPIVRTFAPTVAGAADMTYRQFAVYNVIGGAAWVLSMTLTGYFLGQMFGPALERNIHILVMVVIFLSLVPAGIAWLRERNKKPPAATPPPTGA